MSENLTFIVFDRFLCYIVSMGDLPINVTSSQTVTDASLDAMTLLKQDHVRLRQLLDELGEAAATHAYDRKKSLFRTFKAAVQDHARVEEEIFYPAVMKLRSEAARGAVREALAAHQTVDSIIAEIDEMEPEDGQYDVKVESLRASVARHVQSEEQAMFAQARNHLTDDRLLALGRRMRAFRQGLPAGPSI